MSCGIVDFSAVVPIVMLEEAQHCQDCDAITEGPDGRCGRCGSGALLSLAKVLNREGGSGGAVDGEV